MFRFYFYDIFFQKDFTKHVSDFSLRKEKLRECYQARERLLAS